MDTSKASFEDADISVAGVGITFPKATDFTISKAAPSEEPASPTRMRLTKGGLKPFIQVPPAKPLVARKDNSNISETFDPQNNMIPFASSMYISKEMSNREGF